MNANTPSSSTSEKSWFYEKNGSRIGAISESEVIQLIKEGTIGWGTVVWRQGLPEWLKIENTELRSVLEKTAPPPLSGDNVSNSVIWVLAFAPIIGLMLEYFVAGMMNPNDMYQAELDMEDYKYWYITLILNIALSIWDEARLRKSGTKTSDFKGWVWLVPVYLFQRAKALKHSNSYFITWVVCFVLSIFL